MREHDPASVGTGAGAARTPAVPTAPEPHAPVGDRAEERHVRDANDRRESDVARRALDRRVMAVMESMSDAFLALGPDWRVTYANREAARLNGTTPDALIGRDHWSQWPETVGSEVEREYRRAARERVPVQLEHYYEGAGRWHEIRAYPSDDGGLVVFYRDVTAQRRLEEERARQARELAATSKAAWEASLAKSQFVANTSHEIRTPLNAIIGYAQLLELGLAGELRDAQRTYVERIQATSRHLLAIINDILDLSKIEAGDLRAVSEPALASDVVASAFLLVEPQASARGVALGNGCSPSSDVAFRGDRERARQILVNLLSNAVRFTERGGRVTVTCGTADAPPAAARPGGGRWAFLRVQDTGVGIAPDQLDRIWEAFVQLDANHTRRAGGTGLGLTISRHLARLMGGDLTVRSEPGLGSSFVLWLPAADATEVEPAPAVAGPRGAAEEREDPQHALADVDASEEPGLRAIADALMSEIERVLAMYVARLRSDPGTPSAHRLGEAELEDHAPTLLADMAQCLAAVAKDGPDAAESLRDGSEIQRLIATRHAAQRARLGFGAAELRRDYRILREEVHAAVGRRLTRGGAGGVERALGVLNHFFDAAERHSLGAYGGEGEGA